jgi:prevent-host-death family protein
MTQATIHQAKTHLSKLIRKALDGEEVIIAKRDKPVVRLETVRPKKAQRKLGWGKGFVRYVAPEFDEPLEDFVGPSATVPKRAHEARTLPGLWRS